MTEEMYQSTRQAWQDIWNQASVEVELAELKYIRSQELLNGYIPYLPTDGPILEAGCGLCATLIYLRQQGFNIIGLDYALNALDKGRAYQPDLRLQGGDVHALPYAPDSLAGYLSFGVLEHFEHGLQPGLKEAFRVLRPGGILVLTIPYPNVVWRLVQFKRRLTGQGPLTDDEFYESTYTQHDLIDASTAVGFEVVKVQPLSHAYTLWGLGGPFQAEGYYKTTPLADGLGRVLKRVAPWPFNFSTLLIGRKP